MCIDGELRYINECFGSIFYESNNLSESTRAFASVLGVIDDFGMSCSHSGGLM